MNCPLFGRLIHLKNQKVKKQETYLNNPSPHIALFLPHLDMGGTERIMACLASEFARLGFKVDFVLMKARGSYLSSLPKIIRVINLQAKRHLTSIPGLIQYLRKEKPHILLSALDLTNLIALIAKNLSLTNTRVLIRIESPVSKQKRSFIKKRVEPYLFHYIYPQAETIISVSKEIKLDLARYANIPQSKICTIYNPVITTNLLQDSREPLDHPWFRENEPPVILGVGRLVEVKDFSTLLKAFALVKKKCVARLMILGEGEERINLESLARQLDISKDVMLPGFVSNPYNYMRKSAVFVQSSLTEGLPNVLIESLACGCPVVSTDCASGPSEILDGGKYGHLVPTSDPEAIANAIMKVLAGEKRKPPSDWLEQFTTDTVVSQYLNVMGIRSM